jgi:acetyltransferase-like isoleucine patch superfamily enzyme
VSYYSDDELRELGFASIGRSVLISRKASLYGISRISIGDASRIDDFCVLSAGAGGISIGHHCHIAVMCTIIGRGRVEIGDLSTLSGRVSVYSSSDDYSGAAMTNPTVPEELTRVDHRPVSIGRHVIVGAGTVVLPGAILEDGVAVGALSLVKGSLHELGIYGGVPARRVGPRRLDFLETERQLEID